MYRYIQDYQAYSNKVYHHCTPLKTRLKGGLYAYINAGVAQR